MTIADTTVTKNLGLNARYDQANSGSIKAYTGTVPATADTALSGNTLLFSCAMSATAFAAASGGTKVANTISPDTDAAATGTATFARMYKSDGTTVVCQILIADLNLPTTSIVQHDTITPGTYTITAS